MTHLHLAVSAHGFGHLAQSAPLVEALYRALPDPRLTVQADLPLSVVRTRLAMSLRLLEHSSDVGMCMEGPLDIRWTDTIAAYRAFHGDWDRRLDRQRALFAADPPDLVIADVPYLPLEAARREGIPAVGLCSLAWPDILESDPGAARALAREIGQMRDIYRGADLFLRPAPCMPMDWLGNGREIGCLAHVGSDRRLAILERLHLPAETRLILLQFGGIPGGLDPGLWPRLSGVHWLVAGEAPARGDMHAAAGLDLAFIDLFASVDLLVTKPGYGSFAEAACHGLPVVYLERHDWAETPFLTRWLEARVPARALGAEAFSAGVLDGMIRDLLQCPRPAPEIPIGAAEGVRLILPLLGLDP